MGDALVVGSIVQLLYSTDDQIDGICNVNPFGNYGNDTVVESSTIGTSPGGQAGTFYWQEPGPLDQYNLPDDSYTAGWCYMRVFQATTTMVIAGQTIYYAWGPTASPTIGTGHPNQPPDTPTPVDALGQAEGIYYAMDLSVTVVPEPSTLALFGVGILTVAARLRRNRK